MEGLLPPGEGRLQLYLYVHHRWGIADSTLRRHDVHITEKRSRIADVAYVSSPVVKTCVCSVGWGGSCVAQCYFAFVLPLSSSTEVASARPQGDVAELCFTDASSLSLWLCSEVIG